MAGEPDTCMFTIIGSGGTLPNTTLGGEVLNQIENSQQIGYTDKIVLNWNEGVKQNQILYEFLVKNSEVYPEFRPMFITIGTTATAKHCWYLSTH